MSGTITKDGLRYRFLQSGTHVLTMKSAGRGRAGDITVTIEGHSQSKVVFRMGDRSQLWRDGEEWTVNVVDNDRLACWASVASGAGAELSSQGDGDVNLAHFWSAPQDVNAEIKIDVRRG